MQATRTELMEQRWKVLPITSVGLFMASLDLFIVNIAFPDIAADFSGASLPSLSWVLNAYAIVFAALLVPAGRIADRVGRKRVFILGLLLFAVASALCASRPRSRAGRRPGPAGGRRGDDAADHPGPDPARLPGRAAGPAIGIWSAVGGVAAALGPPLGGMLVQLSWRWIFVVNVPIGIVTAIVAGASCTRSASPRTAAPTCSAPPSWRSGSAC